MRRFSCRLMIVLGVVAASVAVPLLAADLDEDKVRAALLERFDENRNDKLETLEAKQARTRMRNLLEDKSDREINIHTWRDDVKPLLMTLDPDEDRQLTNPERNAAVALLERLIPKVDQDESRGKDKEKSSLGSSTGERKRESGSRRSRGRASSGRSSGYGGVVGPWTMGGGGWGMNRNFGFGGGTSGGGNSFNGGSSSFTTSSSRFFSGSGLENANPAKGDLGSENSQTPESAGKSPDTDQTRQSDYDSEPFGDSPRETPDSSSGKKPDERSGKDKPGPSSPDGLGGGGDTDPGGDSPKPGAPAGPTLIPPVPKPAF